MKLRRNIQIAKNKVKIIVKRLVSSFNSEFKSWFIILFLKLKMFVVIMCPKPYQNYFVQ